MRALLTKMYKKWRKDDAPLAFLCYYCENKPVPPGFCNKCTINYDKWKVSKSVE